MDRLISLSLAFALAVTALAGSAQAAVVGVEARHFAGTGLGGRPVSPNPCCGPGGTFDTRTTGHVLTPTNMSVAIPRGAPFYTEISLDDRALPPTSNDRAYRSVDVDTANGALDIASGLFGFQTANAGPGFPPFTYLQSTRTTSFASAMLAPGGGPGTYSYHMADNPYTRSRQNQNVNTNGGGGATTTTTTTTAVIYDLHGRAGGTAVGANQFGGTWSVIGGSFFQLNRPSVGVAIEIINVLPWGPGTLQPNGPGVRRTVDTAFNFIHAGDINGPIINTVSGPVIVDAFPYTTGMVTAKNTSFITPTAEPVAYADRADTGGDSRTANHLNGNLQLVAPMLSMGFAEGNPADGNSTLWTRRWNLNFVPEPSSLGLISAGTVGLIGLAAARRRKRS